MLYYSFVLILEQPTYNFGINIGSKVKQSIQNDPVTYYVIFTFLLSFYSSGFFSFRTNKSLGFEKERIL